MEERQATDEFLLTTRVWYEARERYAAELAEAEGKAAYAERQNDYLSQLRAVEAGLLRRSLFVAERRP